MNPSTVHLFQWDFRQLFPCWRDSHFQPYPSSEKIPRAKKKLGTFEKQDLLAHTCANHQRKIVFGTLEGIVYHTQVLCQLARQLNPVHPQIHELREMPKRRVSSGNTWRCLSLEPRGLWKPWFPKRAFSIFILYWRVVLNLKSSYEDFNFQLTQILKNLQFSNTKSLISKGKSLRNSQWFRCQMWPKVSFCWEVSIMACVNDNNFSSRWDPLSSSQLPYTY